MNNISIYDVQHLAKLSNLSLSEKEVETLRIDLGNILNYIESLKDLNTEGIEPTYQVTDLQNVFREDEIIDYGITKNNLLDLSFESDGDSIKVPKVL